MVLPIKRITPYIPSRKKKQHDCVILDWQPINLHRFLQNTMDIDLENYWVNHFPVYGDRLPNGKVELVSERIAVMFRKRKDAKRFSYVADPGRI